MIDTDPGPDEGLADQRLRLISLESCEDRIRILRQQEGDLEVEHIAADTALQSATSRLPPKIDPALASRIGASLERRRELEERRRESNEDHGHRSPGGSRRVDQLRAGRAALQAWLDASRVQAAGPVVGAAMLALLIATIAAVWAAFAIHLAFLLLLVVVVGPVSFAMGRGHDAEWRRVGARRRYAGSGLADIAAWDEDSVRVRMEELESLLAATTRDGLDKDAGIPARDPVDAQTMAAQIAEQDEQIASDLAAAGLTIDDMQGETENWLRLVARADRSRASLQRVKNERKRLRAEADEIRDHLLRYLHSRGVKPLQQQDTAAAIAESLERVTRTR